MNFRSVPIIRAIRKLKGRQGVRKIAANTGWLFFDRILRLGVGLFVGAWAARYLGPDQFGILSYATTFVLILSSFAVLGLDNIVVRELVKSRLGKEEILGSAFVLKLIGGFLALVLSITVIFLIKPEDSLMRSIVVITSTGLIFQSFDTIDFYFQSQVQSRYVVYARSFAFLVVSLGKVALVLAKAPLISFAWVGMAEIVMAAGGLVFVYRLVRQNILRWRPRLTVIKSLLNDSWPLFLSGLVVAIYMKIDQLMLGNLVGNAAVGNYSAAVRISEIWYVIPAAISASVFPSIIGMRKINRVLYLDRLQKFYDLMIWLSIAIAVFMTFFANGIIWILYGTQFSAAGPILSIYIWAGIFVFFEVANSQFLMAENLTKIFFYRTAIGGIVNVVLNIIFIPRYQGSGAAAVTITTHIFVSLLIPACFRESRIIAVMFLRSFNFRRITRELTGVIS